MSDPIQLKRRAAQLGGYSWFSLPRPPRFPDKFISRFPELADFNRQQDAWWSNLVAAMHASLTGQTDSDESSGLGS